MFIDPDEDPKSRRSIREAKIKAHLNLVITPENMLFVCKKAGMSIPKGIAYSDFENWVSNYLKALSDDDLKKLMKSLGLTIVAAAEQWNGIFIIHSNNDKYYADAIKRSLNCINVPDSNIYCSSIEETGTNLGESFCNIIKKCLRNAILVVCIMSDASVNSKYCLQEMGAAFVMDTPIIPVLVKGFKPENMPGFIDNTRYLSTDISTLKSCELFLLEVCKKCGIESNPSDLTRGVQTILAP